ncbi:hypothetical protein COU79_04105 [Candidatus Peregrinibacteria bacterium CG10_big_fil_rev_8_21_14_0_10_54_7]|nr:MAG: hypothetical protein COU79_04105 [Candidatus Peregrinibacteria bacterium CG10_big_fil_rev_8_21_14_0_10_54_7]
MKRRLPLFGVVSILILLALLPRFFAERLLYLDPLTRGRVQEALRRTANEEGLLLSGFAISSITDDRLVVHHRAHARGADARRCFTIDLSSFSRTPCDVSS